MQYTHISKYVRMYVRTKTGGCQDVCVCACVCGELTYLDSFLRVLSCLLT